MKLFDATLSTLERSLDVRIVRQTVLAGDLANSDTPGFVPRELDFDAAMAAAVPSPDDGPTARAPRAGDLSIDGRADVNPVAPERWVAEVGGAAPGIDGNSVDVDRTLAAVAENAIQYGASAKAASKKLAILRYVASDGAA